MIMKTSSGRRNCFAILMRALAVAASALGATSTQADGLDTWHRRYAYESNYISALTYRPGSFVLVDQEAPGVFDQGSSALHTSVTGETWDRHPTGTNNLMTGCIAYGNGEYRAVRFSQYAFPAGTVLRSVNGVDWLPVDYGNGEFSYVMKSTKFINGRWLALGAVAPGVDMCLDPFGFPCPPESFLVLFGAGAGSVDLEVPQSWLGNEELNLVSADFAYGNGTWVVLAWVYTGDYFDPTRGHRVALFAWRSTDGTNFVRSGPLVQSPVSGLVNAFEPLPCGVTHGHGRFVAVANNASIYSSADGLSWTTNAVTPSARLRDVAFGAGQFVAVGATGGFTAGAIVTSGDGLNWQHREPGTTEFLRQVEYGAHRFVVIGGTNVVLQSDTVISLGLSRGPEPQFTLSAPVWNPCRIEFTSDLNITDPWQVWTNIEVHTDPLVFPAPPLTEPRRFFRAVLDQ